MSHEPLDDEFDDEFVDGELVEIDDNNVLTAPLDADSARALTETIRNAVDVVWMLIARAHAGKAWKALGYDTWAEYVKAEFDMSRSRSYQLLDQARVVAEIEAAVPDGTAVQISEAAARDLKDVLEDVVPEIKERTQGLSPDDASDVLAEIVEEQRERLREERDAAYMDMEDDEFLDEFDSFPGGGGGGGNYTGDGSGRRNSDEEKPAPLYNDIDEVDVVAIRRAVNAAHDLYSSLSALAGLPPDLEEVVQIIPRERYAQIDGNLRSAQENLARFADLWAEHAGDALDEDDE